MSVNQLRDARHVLDFHAGPRLRSWRLRGFARESSTRLSRFPKRAQLGQPIPVHPDHSMGCCPRPLWRWRSQSWRLSIVSRQDAKTPRTQPCRAEVAFLASLRLCERFFSQPVDDTSDASPDQARVETTGIHAEQVS